MIGTTLAHYEITGTLGKGGMGEVWRARDTKLDREVAIKTLPSEFADDEERLGRFEREAKLLAALNHAHIGTIYGLDEDQGVRFLAMELVEGQTIDERLKDGPLPVDEALRLGLQIAEALEAAHDKGVVHRDLKPANIMVTNEGSIKVLDFGLAKAFSGDPNQASPAHSPALSLAATQQGIILGTAGYMSPEQASGQATDQRADVWAFGVVLFEMLSGLPLFTGESVPHILAGILRTDPEWDRLPKDLDPRIRTLLERCLEKLTRNRYHGIADARVDIEKILSDPEGATPLPGDQTGRAKTSKVSWLAAGLAAAVMVAIAGVVGWNFKPDPIKPIIRMSHVLSEGEQFTNLGRPMVAVSPDGSQVVYVANGQLNIREMSALESRPIAGTDEIPTAPFFSPDGQWIGYFSGFNGQLKKIAVSGGIPVTVASAQNPFGRPFWGTDDTIVWGQAEGVMRVSSNGGVPDVLISAGDQSFGAPQILPDGDSVLIHDLGQAEMLVVSLASGERKTLGPGLAPRYLDTGHIVYGIGSVLNAVPFDLDLLQVTSGPVPIIEGVRFTPLPQFDISSAGNLVWLPGGAVSIADNRVLAMADRNGQTEELDLPPAPYRSPRLSADGGRLAVEVLGADGQSNIWIHDLNGQVQMRQLTRGGNNTRPIWTPDGQRVTFASDREGFGIWWQNADFSGVAERLTTTDIEQRPGSWNPSGEILALTTVLAGSGGSALGVSTYSLESGETDVFYDLAAGNQESPAFSPDGKWLAYSSQEPGATSIQVYVQPFPATGEVHPITTTGEAHPLWSHDGSELFFRRSLQAQAAPAISRVAITTEPAVTWSAQQTLPIDNFYVQNQERSFDITPDGERMLVALPVGATNTAEATRPQINIVVNWFEELKQRVPTQ